ncbi:MAG: YqeG family HAD IIIA-type phosphatase [Lachnospiraceae bacterium]|nr:YqeG family HAD IIIA-type phosphatase [Lachnospiraceae bacterium]
MLERFYPDSCAESTYLIDFEGLFQEGYRAIIFDIDNTLVEHGVKADERCIELFERLSGIGYSTMLLSNNKEIRVKSFFEQIKASGYIYKAGKPLVKNYKHAMELMHSTTQDTLFIGDQLFTDVWGAKKAGIRTILVKPIDKKEEIQIVLKRFLERIVLYFYRKEIAGHADED